MAETSALTKEELSIKICDLLGNIQVDFTPMKKEDLVKLYDYLSKLLRPISEMSVREFLDEVFGRGDRTLRERVIPRARMRLREILSSREEKKEEEPKKET